MFLRGTNRKKDGKDHRYFSVVENRRLSSGKTAQRTVLYLGEVNDKQESSWRKTLEVFDEDRQSSGNLSLFPEDREIPADAVDALQVKLSGLELRRPRAFGNCWLACQTWRQLELDRFWQQRLPDGREAVSWEKVLQLLVVNRLIDPGSEWRVHRHWFLHSAMDELLGVDFAVAGKDRLYRCLDRLLDHKKDLFVWLRQRWVDLFQADFEVLLYDLTSTYFEGAMEDNPKAKRGYSRDKRPDCLQVVIALVVTPDGFPLAYEVMDGNTPERTTLRGFPDKIEATYGKAKRMWVMDRGIPTEEILAEMRNPSRPMSYLAGTPKSKIKQHEKKWLAAAVAQGSRLVGSETVRAGRRVVCTGQKGRTTIERDRHPAQETGPFIAQTAGDAQQLANTRSVDDAHRRGEERSWPGLRLCTDSVAEGAATGDSRVVPVQRGQKQAERGRTARWPLSVTFQCRRGRSSRPVDPLRPIDAD